jgi:hypothetical protein
MFSLFFRVHRPIQKSRLRFSTTSSRRPNRFNRPSTSALVHDQLVFDGCRLRAVTCVFLAAISETHGLSFVVRVLRDLPPGAVVRTELSLTLQGRNARVCFGNVLLARSPFFAIAVAQA